MEVKKEAKSGGGFDWIEAVILAVMFVGTPPMVVYFAVALFMALKPVLMVLWVAVASLWYLVTSMLALMADCYPLLGLIALPLVVMMFQNMSNRGNE